MLSYARPCPIRTIVGIGGFPNDAMLEYVLGLARGAPPALRPHGRDGGSGPDGGVARAPAGARRDVRPALQPVAAGGPARVHARPRPRARSRREHGEHARDLARPRLRRGAARGLGERRRPLRLERRDDLLVRGGRDRLVRAAARGNARRARVPARQRVPALRRRGAAAARVPAARRGRVSGRDRARRRGRGPVRGDRARRGGRVAPAARGYRVGPDGETLLETRLLP